jgi:predicted  nucleic acid-binding Zn-ribbon protein
MNEQKSILDALADLRLSNKEQLDQLLHVVSPLPARVNSIDAALVPLAKLPERVEAIEVDIRSLKTKVNNADTNATGARKSVSDAETAHVLESASLAARHAELEKKIKDADTVAESARLEAAEAKAAVADAYVSKSEAQSKTTFARTTTTQILSAIIPIAALLYQHCVQKPAETQHIVITHEAPK